MLVPDRASIRGLAGNHLIISCLLIILGSFCAEDYTHFAVYQPLTNQPRMSGALRDLLANNQLIINYL